MKIVVRSKCPTYVGASGIVAQETENVFKIITPSNALQGKAVLPPVASLCLPLILNILATFF